MNHYFFIFSEVQIISTIHLTLTETFKLMQFLLCKYIVNLTLVFWYQYVNKSGTKLFKFLSCFIHLKRFYYNWYFTYIPNIINTIINVIFFSVAQVC